MNKKILIIFIILVIIGASIILVVKNNQKEKRLKQSRYLEIKETVKKGIEQNLKARYPNCPIVDDIEEENAPGNQYNASYLINNGYLKKEDLLDYDQKTYCDIFVKVKSYRKNPLDAQKDCNVSYELYLKCSEYQEKGYENWND